MFIYFGVKKGDDFLDVLQTYEDIHDEKTLKAEFEVNPDLELSKIWLSGEIVSITEEQFQDFLTSKKFKDEIDFGLIGSEIADEDVKQILAALVSGTLEVAKKIVEKSRKKPKEDKTPPATR